MPQESLRSVVYRSFVTCEDPRGVVEGKTIRISKTETTKMSSKRAEKEKEKMSLVEVKNGAQKLNEAIDSWSKGASFRTQQKDIAKDLLKGALDLQESLMMLGKLQESTYVTGLKKNEKPSEEELSSRIGSDRFESFRVYDTGYEKERKLANGSSRDCYAELRDVISKGLSKQNLLPNKPYQENVTSRDLDELAGKRKLQLSPDIASTSSSRSSSMMYSTHEFTSSESFSSRATEEKSNKGSNLIAKLMGLDEFFPSKPPPPSPKNHTEITSKLRPVFDFGLPYAKRPQREHMSLDEVIDMMQSKGLLRTNKREMKPTSNKFIDDSPPIVLMRPQHLGHDNQRYKVYENPMRRVHQEKVKVEDKSVKNQRKPKPPSVPVVTKPQRKQETEKKIDKVQKIASPVKRKPVDNGKPTNSVSKSASPKQVKPQRNAIQNPVPKRTSSNQKKNVKVQKPVADTLPTVINEDLAKDSASQEESQDFFKVTMKEVEDRDSDAVSSMDHDESSVSDLSGQKAKILKTISSFQDSEQVNDELVQDCITEFLEHENQNQTQNPFLRIIFPLRVSVSEDQMTRDIVKRIQNLRSFSTLSNDSSNAADIVPVLLETDLYLSTHGGAWSTTGWKDGCTINEVEEAVLDLEKIILSRLIDEMLMELVTKGRFVQNTFCK